MTAMLSSIRQTLSSRNLMVVTLTQGLFMFTASLWWPYWSLYRAPLFPIHEDA